MKRKFGEITTFKDGEIKIEDYFNLIRENDYENVYESIKTFKHEEEDSSFEYKYLISVVDMCERTGDEEDEGKIVIELNLSILPTSLNKEILNKITNYVGGDEDCDWQISVVDVLDYGYGITMASELIKIDEYDKNKYVFEDKSIIKILENICIVYESVDKLRGFYLDKPWNMIGNTGWDTINECINNVDSLEIGLSRFKCNKKECI